MIDPFIMSVLANYVSALSLPVVQEIFNTAFKIEPSIASDFKNIKSISDFEDVFRKAVGVIDATAGTGTILIDKSFLEAMNGIKIDHENGKVNISGSKLNAPKLQVGGTGSGNTEITGSVLRGGGASVNVGSGAQIKISGGAQIRIS